MFQYSEIPVPASFVKYDLISFETLTTHLDTTSRTVSAEVIELCISVVRRARSKSTSPACASGPEDAFAGRSNSLQRPSSKVSCPHSFAGNLFHALLSSRFFQTGDVLSTQSTDGVQGMSASSVSDAKLPDFSSLIKLPTPSDINSCTRSRWKSRTNSDAFQSLTPPSHHPIGSFGLYSNPIRILSSKRPTICDQTKADGNNWSPSSTSRFRSMKKHVRIRASFLSLLASGVFKRRQNDSTSSESTSRPLGFRATSMNTCSIPVVCSSLYSCRISD